MPDSLLATGAVSEGLVVSLCGLGAFCLLVVWAFCRAAATDTRLSELQRANRRALEAREILRQIESGEYRIPTAKAPSVMADLFPDNPRWRKERAS